jgi:transposase-like protein
MALDGLKSLDDRIVFEKSMTMRRKRRPLLTRAKKEERIWMLHEEGSSISEITHEVGVSATTAQKVIKAREESLLPKEKSKRSQALVLYGAGGTVRSVSIELDIPVHEAEEYLIESHKADGIDYLEKLRSQLGPSFPHLIDLAEELLLHGMSVEEMNEAIFIIKHRQELQAGIRDFSYRRELLQQEVDSLTHSKNALYAGYLQLSQDYQKLQESSNLARYDLDQICQSIQEKQREDANLDAIIKLEIDSSEVCRSLNDFIGKLVKQILDNDHRRLILTTTAMAAVFARDGNLEFQSLLFHPELAVLNVDIQRKFSFLVSKTIDQLSLEIEKTERAAIYEQAKKIAQGLDS